MEGESGAPSGALGTENGSADLDLAFVVEHWQTLPEHVRATIVSIINAAALADDADA